MSRTLVKSDAFTYSNGALATVSSGDWTSINSGSATLNCSGNKAVSAHVNYAIGRWEGGSTGAGTWTADQYAKAAITRSANSGNRAGVIVRCSADTNANRDYYAAYVMENAGSADTFIIKTVNGTNTTLSNVSGDGWADGDTIEIEAEGTTIRVFRNGVELRNVTDSSISGASTDRAGILIYGTAMAVDDWEGGTISTATGTEALTGSASTGGQTAPSITFEVPL